MVVMVRYQERYKSGESMPMHKKQLPQSKSPLRWQGILFALAANLLLVTVGSYLAPISSGMPALVATALLSLVAGLFTARYVGQRGGMHAFIGGMLSVPILLLAVFAGFWQPALLSGALCALGGALTELRSRSS